MGNTEAHDLEVFNFGSELGFFLSLKNFLLRYNVLVHFPARAASILFLSIFGHKIGVHNSPSLFQGKSCKLHDLRSCASGNRHLAYKEF